MALENVFSWSKSREEQFRECQRKYFYDKYASWGGWDRQAPKEARLAYVLKNLKNRWAWKGETVHHLIENVLKSVRFKVPLSYDSAVAQLTDTMRRDYRDSKAKKYLEEPKKTLGLFEHEYEKPVTDLTWKKIHEESAQCLKNFFDSSLYQELLNEDVSRWLVIEDLEEFDFEGNKIYVKLDFARKKEDVIEIYDWKTGKPDPSEGASIQMAVYAMYAMGKWKAPLNKIQAYLFNLTQSPAERKSQLLSESAIEAAKKTLSAGIADMKRLLADPVKNIPKPEEAFAFTENTRFCDNCNFRKICKKFLS